MHNPTESEKPSLKKSVSARGVTALWLLGMAALAFLICTPLLGDNVYFPSHEGWWVPMRVFGIDLALTEGQCPPQVLPNLVGGMGSGWHIFYPPLAYLFTWSWYELGFPLLSAVKFAHFLMLFLSGVTMFVLVYRITRNHVAAGMSGLLYLSAPYHLIDFYVRNAFAETFAFLWLPVIFFGAWEILHGVRQRWWILAVGMAAMLLTHIISAFYSIFFLLLYVIASLLLSRHKGKEIKVLFFSFSAAALLATALAAFFLIPMAEHIIRGDYVAFDPALRNAFGTHPNHVKGHALRLDTLLDWRLPLNHDTFGSLGYRHTGPQMPLTVGPYLVLLAVIGLFRTWSIPSTRILSVLAITALFMTTRYHMLWAGLPDVFSMLQFPWRLLLFATFFLCWLSGLAFSNLSSPVMRRFFPGIVLLSLIIFLAISVREVTRVTPEADMVNEPLSGLGATGSGEYFPVRYLRSREALLANTETMRFPVFVEGSGFHEILPKKGAALHLLLSTEGKAVVQLPVIFYLGYRVVDEAGNVQPVFECDNGLLCVRIHRTNEYFLYYRNTGWGIAANVISLCALVFLFFCIFRKRLISRQSGHRSEC